MPEIVPNPELPGKPIVEILKTPSDSTLEPPLNPTLIEEIVTLEILKNVFQNYDETFEVLDFKAETGTNRGDNYLSIMFAVDVRLKRNSESGSTIEILNIMFKAIPRNPTRLYIVQEGKYFLKETLMYNHVLPFLVGGTSFGAVPKCLGAFYDAAETGYIVMENLQTQGFKMLPRNQWLDMAHATLVIKELAKFHALSFAKWNGDGEAILKSFPDIVETQWLHPDKVTFMTKLFATNTFPDLQKFLVRQNYPEEGKLALGHMQNILSRMHEVTTVSKKFPNVINHGDLWSNNMLFRYDDNGSPNEVKLVDYQISKVGSRMLDLSYVIYTSLQASILNNNLMDLLRVYHQTFENFLTTDLKFNYPIQFNDQNLTWDLFIEEWEAYKYYGITMSLIYLPCMCANPENIPDMEDIDLNDLSDKEDSKFSDFMNVEYTLPRLINLVKFHLPA